MATGLILLPLIVAALAALTPANRWRPWLLPAGAVLHLGLLCLCLQQHTISEWDGWLVLDPLGKVFLLLIGILYTLCMFYAPAYLRLRADRPNRVMCSCLLAGLSMMTLVILSHHLGLMWVAMEATTLASAPALTFNRNPRSLEATWKYLVICSVGIALALLGSFFLAYASLYAGQPTSLLFEDLVRQAPRLASPWLHAAFILLLVGYGTKMGLAPMHTWKPDAYGESPGLVGALLAGGLTNCAFLAVLRFYQIGQAAGDVVFMRRILIFMGLLSMATAALFMVRQRDFKRLLAYSSVEHMGILVLALGIGGAGIFAMLLHMLNNGLTKGVLFLSAGNIHRAYASKFTDDVSGALRRVPVSGALFLAGFLAMTGSPPFGPFISEFSILNAALGSGQYLTGGLFVALLALVFLAMGVTVLAVVLGKPGTAAIATPFREGFWFAAPVVVLLGLVLMLGLFIPSPLTGLLHDAATFLEPSR
ncbi:MAG TPA: proton-conducting transporter membrane subunit [Gemmataceae bacterium]|jgi:hydrogenase-4 component F|nr:proton-conducting transporter membrane subunit [Gemmataceae bacterium]